MNRLRRNRAIAFAGGLMVLATGNAAGQAPAGPVVPPAYQVTRWGTDQGLPGNYISDLTQGPDGSMWVVAATRLVRFDGVRFDRFDVALEPGGAEATAMSVVAGRGDTVWVLTDAEQILAMVDGRFESLGHPLPGATFIRQSTDGRLWVMGRDGVAVLREGTFHRVADVGTAGRLLDGLLLGPKAWADGRGLWMVAAGAPVLYRVGLDGLEETRPTASPVVVPWPSKGRAVFPHRVGDRVEVVDEAGTLIAAYPAADERVPRLVDRTGLLWVTRRGWLEAYTRGRTDPVATVPLAAAGPGYVVEDVEGNLWLSMLTEGLWRVSPRPFHDIVPSGEVDSRPVQALGRGRDGSVLLIYGQGDLYRVSNSTVNRVPGVPGGLRTTPSAYEDETGALWTLRGDTVTVSRPDGTVSRLSVPHSWWLRGLPSGGVWVVQRPGLSRVEDTGEDLVARESYLEDRILRDVLPVADGGLWAAGNDGIWHLRGGRVQAEYLAADGYPTDHSRALYRDSVGDLWIGRYFGGLVQFDGREFHEVRERDGLYEDVVSTIVPDELGNLWMGGNRAIHKVPLNDLRELVAGSRDQVRGVGYGRGAGLINPEATGWHAYAAPDGTLWFPTFGGAVRVNPALALELNSRPPNARIRGVRASGQRLPGGASMTAPLGDRDIEIEYVGISMRDPAGVRYQVRMEGVDENWVDVGDQRTIRYADLRPGRRRFEVRAINESGVWSEPAGVVLRIPPFFRETIWFPVLLALGLGAMVFASFRWRTRQHRLREAELSVLVAERTRQMAGEKARAEQALTTVAEQAEQLRALSETRSRLVANVSHELRTPLTLILGPLKDLVDGSVGELSERARDHVRLVLASGRRLHRLVDQLLDVARLQAGVIRPRGEAYDAVAFLESMAAAFRPMANHRAIAFDVELPEEVVAVRMDPDSMEKVFSNLLGNAFKFTPDGGTVALTATVDRPGGGGVPDLVVVVEDNGPGIPGEEVDRIFDRFHQVDDSPRRAHQGVGLGLSLVRELVELHEGSVEVESAMGRGARFRVRLPAAPAAEAIRRPAAEPAGEELEWSVSASRPAEAGSPEPGPEADEDAPTVLLVEDDGDLRAFIRGLLEGRYRVVESVDGETGLERARELVPDLVISDVMMPGMDGQALCEAIKGDPELDFVPVILLTARATRESRISGLEGGADDYLVKPFDAQELRLRIRNTLESRKRLRERLLARGLELPALEMAVDRESADTAFLEDLRRAIAAGLGDEDFSVDDMASAVAVSRSTLYRRVQDVGGQSPMDLLWEARLEHAAAWLRETAGTVAEVAYAAGFKSVPHFTRRFRERFGRTPAAFKREKPAPGEQDGTAGQVE